MAVNATPRATPPGEGGSQERAKKRDPDTRQGKNRKQDHAKRQHARCGLPDKCDERLRPKQHDTPSPRPPRHKETENESDPHQGRPEDGEVMRIVPPLPTRSTGPQVDPASGSSDEANNVCRNRRPRVPGEVRHRSCRLRVVCCPCANVRPEPERLMIPSAAGGCKPMFPPLVGADLSPWRVLRITRRIGEGEWGG
jgi:hypothetical protein